MARHHGPSVASAAMLLGIGLGGFLDGIVLHQLVQSHSMLSAKVPRDTVVGLQVNMFWDGVFHLATWTATIIGVMRLWRAVQRTHAGLRTAELVGGMAFGWGLFNLVEGTLNHHLLHLHHVVETARHHYFDFAFLASGVILMVAGAAFMRRQPPAARPENRLLLQAGEVLD